MKPRISIWMHGGVGGGPFSQGQPPVQNLINRLATQYDVVVYSRIPPNDDFKPKDFSVVTPSNFLGNWLGWIHLILKFSVHHIRNPYHVFYACWGYPTGFITTLLGKIFRRPSLIHLQGGDCVSIPSLQYGAFHTRTGALLCRWAYNRCSSLVALTDFQVSLLRTKQIHRNITVIPFGVNLNRFRYQPKPLSKDKVQFLHVGNQNPIKDQVMLLDTFLFLKKRISCHLTIIGEGPSELQLKSYCDLLGLKETVTFLTTQRNEELPYFYHRADVLIHTSVFEGQGLVINEAAACGTLLAGTWVGVLADMGASCAIGVASGEAELLAEKILNLIQSSEHMQTLRQAAYDWVKQNEEEKMVLKISTEINRLLIS